MNKIVLLLCFSLFSILSYSQKSNDIVNLSDSISLNEKPSIFPKGLNEFRKMILDNFNMGNITSIENIYCEIIFIVERDGSISNIEAKGDNQNFNKEAVSAVSKINEKWIPAEIDGQKVRSRYRVPLNITISEDNSNEIKDNVEENAQFEGGFKVFENLVLEKIRKRRVSGKGEFTSESTFVVEKNGTISNVEVKGNNESFNKEVVHAIMKVSKLWKPAIDNGITVRSRLKFALTLIME